MSGSTRFGAFQVPAYRRLFASGTAMFLALFVLQIARGWLAVELTGTSAGVGGVYLAFGIPTLLLSPWGGVVADRFPKRRVITICQSTILFGALFVGVAYAFDSLEYWMLLLAAAIHSSGNAVLGPTRIAFTSELVDREMLPNAVVLNQMGVNGTRIIGPALGGTLIGIHAIGIEGAYVLASAVCLFAVLLSLRLPYVAPRQVERRRSPFRDLVDGWRYTKSKPDVFRLVLASTVVLMFGFPFQALLPAMARHLFDVGASGYGVLNATSAVAALAVTFWLAGRVGTTDVWRTQTVFGTTFGLGIVFLGISPTYLLALGAIAVVGGASSGFNISNSSLVLMNTDPWYHGRVQALLMVGFAISGMMALPLGALADHVGLRVTLVGMGAACLAAMAGYVVSRARAQVPDTESATAAPAPEAA